MRKGINLRHIIVLLLVFAMLFSTTLMTGCKDSSDGNDTNDGIYTPTVDPIDDNYRTFYQIFVGSFSDSDGDTIGDLRGIINRIDYLNDGDINSGKSLGVQGIWLSPIFSSPTYHKYDARDYYKIDPMFGTEEDLKELIELCNERNIKLILDMAFNHTSTQHEWFVQFRQARLNGDASNKYYDYYTFVTADERVNGRTYQKIGGIDGYYECNFSTGMPELNFDNPQVREEVLKVGKYYLDLGVHGFRFDAIKYIYYGDTPKTVEFWEWYMDELLKINPDIYCVGECWSGEAEILEYYGAMNCFNFVVSQAEGVMASAAKGQSISKYTNYIEAFQDNVQAKNPDGMAMSFLSNHDMDRIAGAFILENNMRMAANLYLLSPGSPIIYYGEEIGMRGSRGAANTDANRRLAMLWGDGDLVGDPTGSTYPSDKQVQTSVALQLEDEGSLYNYYRKLIAIRHKYPAIARGEYNSVTSEYKNLGGFYIEHDGKVLGLFHNNSAIDTLSIDLSTCADLDGHTFTKLCDYIGMGAATLEGSILTIEPQTSVIIE